MQLRKIFLKNYKFFSLEYLLATTGLYSDRCARHWRPERDQL